MLNRPPRRESLETVRDSWIRHWPEALERWSRFTRLSDPRWCFSAEDEKQQGLSASFAMIRLTDQAVVISLPRVVEHGVERFALEVLAHEIGHHVYCPGSLLDQGRMLARMRRALPTKEHLVPTVANLYADLLVNDRLQRGAGLDIAGVYRTLAGGSTDRMWTLYMRIYEILWSLRNGTLATGKIDGRLEGDAQLGARLIRSYARDWLEGTGRFAALCLPYLLDDDPAIQKLLRAWWDTRSAGAGGDAPAGLAEIDEGELDGAIHPALDPDLAELEPDREDSGLDTPPEPDTGPARTYGQHREPFEYGEILKSLGLELSDHEIAVRYYRERAAPHLVRFPTRVSPPSTEPLPEGLETWDLGHPLEDADWLNTVLTSPRIVPGMTTVQRTWGTMEGSLPERRPIDLDLYVDCSGSMPNPQIVTSYLALAGAIIALSALRVGSRVQATLWSGARQFETTGGFISDPHRILRILTGYLGGATAFPIHLLRDTHQSRAAGARPVHILVISDDGIDTMFQQDERGSSGWEIARRALDQAKGGGTLVLNLSQDWQRYEALVRAHDQGWHVHRVQTWEDLVAFARAFSRARYEEPAARGR